MDKKKILIVDFDQEFLKFLSQFLHNEGFNVLTAADGFAGLEKYKAERPDLVITEAMLPKLHGFELCSRVTNNQGWKTPVIIVTGVYKDTIYKTEALRTFGASSYFEKPLDTDELMTSIRKILGLSAGPAKKEEVLDEAILQSILPTAKEETRSNGHPPEESPEPEKPSKKDVGGDDIDNMLQSTLAGLGMAAERKKAPPVKVQTPVVKPVRPARIVPPTPTPVPQPQPPRVEKSEPKPEPRPEPRPEPKPAKIKVEEPKTEARKPALESQADLQPKVSAAPFGEFMEPKKKGLSPKVIGGAVAGGLVIVAAMVFIMKPSKGKTAPEVAARPPRVVTDTAVNPPVETPAPKVETPAETQRSVPEPAPRQVNPKPAVQKPAAATTPAFDDIKPLESEARPQLDIKIPETSAQSNTNVVSETPPPVQETPAPQNEVETPKTEAPALPVMSVKTGDLIPLRDVDVQPQTIKTENPVYPPIAMRLGIEGTVTVNALISETGNVVQTAIIKGIKGTYGFDKAAEDAVKKWKFQPAQKNGVNVRVWKPISMIFKLKK